MIFIEPHCPDSVPQCQKIVVSLPSAFLDSTVKCTNLTRTHLLSRILSLHQLVLVRSVEEEGQHWAHGARTMLTKVLLSFVHVDIGMYKCQCACRTPQIPWPLLQVVVHPACPGRWLEAHEACGIGSCCVNANALAA